MLFHGDQRRRSPAEQLEADRSRPGVEVQYRRALQRATGLQRVGDGGGVDGEDITVHAIPLDGVPAWLQARAGEGCEIDLKLWGGLWLARRQPDGTPAPGA